MKGSVLIYIKKVILPHITTPCGVVASGSHDPTSVPRLTPPVLHQDRTETPSSPRDLLIQSSWFRVDVKSWTLVVPCHRLVPFPLLHDVSLLMTGTLTSCIVVRSETLRSTTSLHLGPYRSTTVSNTGFSLFVVSLLVESNDSRSG